MVPPAAGPIVTFASRRWVLRDKSWGCSVLDIATFDSGGSRIGRYMMLKKLTTFFSQP